MIDPETGPGTRPGDGPVSVSASEPSGERFIPEVMADLLIEAEHQVRYRFAAAVAGGRRVLDAGCGVGWGSVVLLEGGAATVTGVDLDHGALVAAAARRADLSFVRGDLENLPFGDAEFDLVTCFEAIEHVPDPHRVLDELRRVLVPTGVLMVSSPNPQVYRAGNPFHIHEFEPDELLDEVRRRFAYADVWFQHGQLGSALRRGDAPGPVPADILGPVAIERAVYCVVVAGDAELPVVADRVALVSSRQLEHLDEAAEGLRSEGRSLQEEWERVVAERARYLAEHERIAEERVALLAEHQRIVEERQVLLSEFERIAEERLRVLAEHSAVHGEVRWLTAEVAHLREQLRLEVARRAPSPPAG